MNGPIHTDPLVKTHDGTQTNPPNAPQVEAPPSRQPPPHPEPTRYGDWEKCGRCIDF